MPAMVGGFGKMEIGEYSILRSFNKINRSKKEKIFTSIINAKEKIQDLRRFGPYLAGLIEGDGTFAIKNPTNQSNHYNPHIIVVFKIADLELANFLCKLTGCGKVEVKTNRNYVLWKITNILDVYIIVSVINGYMRTPKHETLIRYLTWYNNYIIDSADYSINLPKLVILPIDISSLSSNSWLSGFVDADGHFAISITKRSNGKIRIISRFSLEQRINYHRDTNLQEKTSYSNIMISIAELLNGSLYTRSRTVENKTYYSYIVMCFSQNSKEQVIHYFDKYSLWSSKYLDYLDWKNFVQANQNTISNEQAFLLRKDFNSTRTTFTWKHLSNFNNLTNRRIEYISLI